MCEVSREKSGLTQNESLRFPLRAGATQEEWKTGFYGTHKYTHALMQVQHFTKQYQKTQTHTHNNENIFFK